MRCRNVCVWHLASFRTCALNGRYWTNSGQSWILARDGLSANDPKRTSWSIRDWPMSAFEVTADIALTVRMSTSDSKLAFRQGVHTAPSHSIIVNLVTTKKNINRIGLLGTKTDDQFTY